MGRRRSKRWLKWLSVGSVCASLSMTSILMADEPNAAPAIVPAAKSGPAASPPSGATPSYIFFDPEVTPTQVIVPQQPTLPVEPTTGGAASGGLLGSGGVGLPNLDALPAARAEVSQAPGGTAVLGGQQTQMLATSDAGDLLSRSTSGLGVDTQRRSPIANEARIRGYRLGQIYTFADGQYWFPARNDLDTFLSKIDSGLIRDAVIVKGPYSAKYGPGFAFIDIETDDAPRFANGMEWHGRTTTTYKDNGQQLYGRQMFIGGSTDWGVRLSYGQRIGNDYMTGNGPAFEIPSSYNARDIDFVYGFNLAPNQTFEVGYLRLDQTDLEFPGQVFDTKFLVTDGFRVGYRVTDSYYFDEMNVTGYYNRTSFAGDAQQPGKRRQIPSLDVSGYTGRTDADIMNTGTQMAFTWGRRDEIQWTVGTDFRILNQALNEFDQLFFLPCDLNFPIPRTEVMNVGLFVENTLPVSSYLTIRSGGRVDLQTADVRRFPKEFSDDQCDCSCELDPRPILGVESLDREYTLWMGYSTAEFQLTRNITLLGGFGFAMRPPTPTELFALNPFLATLQQGFTTVQGNPDLEPEKLHQMDIGMRADYGFMRLGMSGFFSWINDYVTFEAIGGAQGKIPLSGFDNALNVRFVNTSLATLWGGEAYTEIDYNEYITPYATLTYVEGQDQTRGNRGQIFLADGSILSGPNREPLPNISPLEARIGLKLHDEGPNSTIGIDFSSRIVAQQNRVASSLLEQPTPGFVVYDLRGFWRPREGVLLTAGLENAFNKFYREHLDLRTGLGVYQPGRTFYAGLELRY